jgi:RNA methyltransferase, TrmH family
VTITSAANPRLKRLRAALRGGERDTQSPVAIEGVKLIQEAIQSQVQIEEIFMAESQRRDPEAGSLIGQIRHLNTEVIEVADRVFASISSTESPQGLLALARLPRFELNALLEGTPLLLVALELQDPGNLGTLLRSAEAFGARAVLLTRKSASPSNPKVVRASAGSIFRMPCLTGFESQALMDELVHRGFLLVATTPRAPVDFRRASYRGKAALLIGNEARGLNDRVLRCVHTQVRIPMAGLVESLNAAIAVSIVLCEAARQREMTNSE